MKKIFYFILLSFAFACHNASSPTIPNDNTPHTNSPKELPNDGLNRNPSHIRYSKHARCRMECRHIDENEVLDMLHSGEIDYRKSQLDTDACHKRYAIEGTSKGEKLRIIFVSCGDEVTVVTCIDIGKEWACHCPGDTH